MNGPMQCVQQHLTEVLPQGERLHFQDGQVLFYAGHHATGLFVLQEGQVSFSLEAPEHEPMPNHMSQSHRLLGVWSLFNDVPYELTCRADGPVEVVFLSKVTVAELLAKHADEVSKT